VLGGGPAVVPVGGGEVVPVGGSAVVLAIDLLVGAVDECAVGAICRRGGGAAAVVVAGSVARGPAKPREPVVVLRAAPVTATVEVVCLAVRVTAGRVVVVAIGAFFLVMAGRAVVTVPATVPGAPEGLVDGTVIVVGVVAPVVGTLAASEAPRSSVL